MERIKWTNIVEGIKPFMPRFKSRPWGTALVGLGLIATSLPAFWETAESPISVQFSCSRPSVDQPADLTLAVEEKIPWDGKDGSRKWLIISQTWRRRFLVLDTVMATENFNERYTNLAHPSGRYTDYPVPPWQLRPGEKDSVEVYSGKIDERRGMPVLKKLLGKIDFTVPSCD